MEKASRLVAVLAAVLIALLLWYMGVLHGERRCRRDGSRGHGAGNHRRRHVR